MKDYLKQFNTTAEYNTYINGTPDLPNVSLTLDDNEVHYNKKPDYSKEYLTFEALESGTFTFKIGRLVSPSDLQSISYSIDGGTTWTTTQNINYETVTITTPTIAQGGKVLWKGNGSRICDNSSPTSSISSTGSFNVSGNIMSLMYDNFADKTMLEKNNTFNYLFQNSNVISAENLILPATTLTNSCYMGMFSDCTGLTTTPVLPATTLTQSCYNNMFQNCASLTTAPELPATTLANQCYYWMFKGCISLTSAPSILPATTLGGRYCYQAMFYGCTSLTTAPELPATTLVENCYREMFSGCTNLNSITMFATTIPDGSLYNWVDGVAATGTFTKAASMTTLPTGANGIPENWTVVDA